jgi:hypothetical protein
VFRHSGVPAFRCSGIQVFRHFGVPAFLLLLHAYYTNLIWMSFQVKSLKVKRNLHSPPHLSNISRSLCHFVQVNLDTIYTKGLIENLPSVIHALDINL